MANQNSIRNKTVFRSELIGMVFIILLGSALHFTYELSGQNPLIGVFSAINESVWEHLKLAFWPSILFMLVQYLLMRKSTHNFFVAKALGASLMIVTIPTIFYSYTAVTGKSIFTIDIASFIIAVILGQLASYKLLIKAPISQKLTLIGIGVLIVLSIVFMLFTFCPPQIGLFQDPVTGTYGIR